VAEFAGDDEVALLDAVEVEALHAVAEPGAVSGELSGDALRLELQLVGCGETAADGAGGAVGAGCAGGVTHLREV
jgi:hypothetical protein